MTVDFTIYLNLNAKIQESFYQKLGNRNQISAYDTIIMIYRDRDN